MITEALKEETEDAAQRRGIRVMIRGARYQCRHQVYKQLTSDQIKKWGHEGWTKQVLKTIKMQYMQKLSMHNKSGCCAVLQAKERGVKYIMLIKNV